MEDLPLLFILTRKYFIKKLLLLVYASRDVNILFYYSKSVTTINFSSTSFSLSITAYILPTQLDAGSSIQSKNLYSLNVEYKL